MKKETVKSLNAAVEALICSKLDQLGRSSLYDVTVKTTIARCGARSGSGHAYCQVKVTRIATINPGSHHALDQVAQAAFFNTEEEVVEGREAGWRVFRPTISSRDGWVLTLGY